MLQRIGVAQATLARARPALSRRARLRAPIPLGVAIVREQILEAKARGATIVLNSHQLPEVERVCDRVVFIDHGRLTRTETLHRRGRLAAARRRPRSRRPRRARRARRSSAAGIARRARRPDGRAAARRTAATPTSPRAVKALALADVAGPRGPLLGRARGALPRGAPVMIEMARRFLRQKSRAPASSVALAAAGPARRAPPALGRSGGPRGPRARHLAAPRPRGGSVSRDASSGALQMILAPPDLAHRLPVRTLPRHPGRIRRSSSSPCATALPSSRRPFRARCRAPPLELAWTVLGPAARRPARAAQIGGHAALLLDVPARLRRRRSAIVPPDAFAGAARPSRPLSERRPAKAARVARESPSLGRLGGACSRGEPFGARPPGAGCSRSRLLSWPRPLVLFSRREFAYGQD